MLKLSRAPFFSRFWMLAITGLFATALVSQAGIIVMGSACGYLSDPRGNPDAQKTPDSASVCVGGPGPGQGTTTFTTTYTTSLGTQQNVLQSQDVFAFETHLIGIGQGGVTVYDQTFLAPFADSTVTGAIGSLESLLAGLGATSSAGPTLLSSATVLSNSTSSSSVDSLAQEYVTTVYYIPNGSGLVLQTGDVSPPYCASFVPVNATQGFPSGCDPTTGTLFPVAVGDSEVDVNVHDIFDRIMTTTTTTTHTTTAYYEIDGVFPDVTPVPEPSTCLTVLTGTALLFLMRRRSPPKSTRRP